MSEQSNKKSIKWYDKAGLSPVEFMEITGLSRSHTYKLIQSGEIPSVRLGSRRIIIPVQAVEELLNKGWKNDSSISR